MWDKVLPYLEQDFGSRYDARGMDSARCLQFPTPSSKSARTYLRCLKESQSKPCISAVFASGGLVGLWLSTRCPEKIKTLVLANTGARIGTREGSDARIAAVQSHGMAPIAPN